MATFHGKFGAVRFVGSNDVAEVVEFTIDQTIDVVEDTEMGDTARTYLAGIPSWTGRVRCHWDDTDSNGQESTSAQVGDTISFIGYPEGTATGKATVLGSAIVTGASITVTRDGVNSREFTLQGTGALSYSTVGA